MIVLGIETSCDDTAIGIVQDGTEVLSNVRHTQPEHSQYGGVVPELAGRLHSESWSTVLDDALAKANLSLKDIDAIAVTNGPGLQPALLNGTTVGSFLSLFTDIPVIPVHHISGHVTSCALDRPAEDVEFPALVLTVSGGHTSMYRWENGIDITELGKTRDDAAGEVFDKVSKMLGLGYPGGPIVSKLAKTGNPTAFELPRIYLEKETLDFSFSGLKAAVRRIIDLAVEKNPTLLTDDTPENNQWKSDLCASFEEAVARIFCKKIERGFEQNSDMKQLHFVGGVSANVYLRERFTVLCKKLGKEFLIPTDFGYCTDNGAMIAGVGYLKIQQNPELLNIQCLEAKPRLNT